VMTPGDRERVAYHESGHALLGLLVPGGSIAVKVAKLAIDHQNQSR